MNSLLRRTGYLILATLACVYVVFALRGPRGLPALMEKRRQIAALQEENATLAAETQRRQERIHRLETDRAAQELEIRKRLKKIRPGETEFVVPRQTPESESRP